MPESPGEDGGEQGKILGENLYILGEFQMVRYFSIDQLIAMVATKAKNIQEA